MVNINDLYLLKLKSLCRKKNSRTDIIPDMVKKKNFIVKHQG